MPSTTASASMETTRPMGRKIRRRSGISATSPTTWGGRPGRRAPPRRGPAPPGRRWDRRRPGRRFAPRRPWSPSRSQRKSGCARAQDDPPRPCSYADRREHPCLRGRRRLHRPAVHRQPARGGVRRGRRWPRTRCRRWPGSSTFRRPCSCCRRRSPAPPTGRGSSRPNEELPFAGHPSVGAAVTQCAAWAAAGRPGLAGVRRRRAARRRDRGRPGHAHRRSGHRRSRARPGAVCWRRSGLGPADRAGPAAPRRRLRPGLPLPGRQPGRRGPGPGACRRTSGDICVFAWDDAAAGRARHGSSRRGMGVPEDPATGSAALGLGVYLVATGVLKRRRRVVLCGAPG